MDPLDVRLEDKDRLEEVELYSSLIVAANQSQGRLTDEQIDRALGLR